MAKKKTTVLVTGGAGFVGSHLVDALVKKGYRVLVIDRKMRWLNPKAKYYKMNVTSTKVCEVLKREKPEYIFHLAAQILVPKSVDDPIDDAKTNIMGTLNLLEGCHVMDEYCKKRGYCVNRQLKKFIYFSSAGVYGSAAKPPVSETAIPTPDSPYGVSKLAAEHYLEAFHKMYGLPFVSLRPANIYGPRAENGIIPIFISRLFQKKTATIEGTGKATRDFVYVDDVVRAAVMSMRRTVNGPVNVGTGKEVSVKLLFKTVKKLTGSKQPEVHTEARVGDIHRSALKMTRAKKVLGWSPKTSFEQGMKKTVQWHKKRLKT